MFTALWKEFYTLILVLVEERESPPRRRRSDPWHERSLRVARGEKVTEQPQFSEVQLASYHVGPSMHDMPSPPAEPVSMI